MVVIKSSVTGGIVRSKPCIDTCHQLSEEKILARTAKERLFALVGAQPHRSNLECYNDIRTSLSEEYLGALFYIDSLSTLRSSLQRWRRGIHPHAPQTSNEIPSIEKLPYIYTLNKSDEEETFLFLDRIYYIPPEGNNGTAYFLLAFVSKRSATEIANASKVLIVGTFKVAQLFTISSFRGENPDKIQMVPRCWTLQD